jgi:polysaccharide biosynthesis/export protein
MLKRRTLLFFALCLPVSCLSQSDNSVSKTIEITGKVRNPGKYELRDQMRIADAVDIAGGFLDFANTRKIMLIRGTERRNFNYRDWVQGKRSEENILLERGDVIVVP